jgi:hypothetical protein
MEESQKFINTSFENFSGHTEHAAYVTEKLTGCKLFGQAISVRQIAANAANKQTVFDDVVIENSRASARWTEQSQQYANRRRLAGAIVSHETENVSRTYREGHVIDSARVAEDFAQRADFYRVFIWQFSRSAR